VRWRAWLSATPRPLEDSDRKKPDERTRGERILASKAIAEHAYLESPVDLGYFQHIADYLFEVGPTTGDEALDWPSLESWARVMGLQLDPFRASAIITLSREFLAALGKSRDPLCRLADLLGD
jgi:hypothetical protein